MRDTLTRRICIALVVLLVLAAGLALVLVDTSLTAHYLSDRGTLLRTQAGILADIVAVPLSDGRMGEVLSATASLARTAGGRALVIGPDRVVIADSAGLLAGREASHDEVLTALSGNRTHALYRHSGDGWVMYATAPIRAGDGVAGAVLLSQGVNSVYRSISDVNRRLAVALLISLCLAIPVSLVVARAVSGPLLAVSAAASRFGLGDLRARVRPGGSSEMRDLAVTFNRMAERVEAADVNRRRFFADASHELRTPLSSARALVGAVLGDKAPGPPLVREYLGDVDQELDRMAGLVNNLLALARLDSPDFALLIQKTPLAGLAAEISRRFFLPASAAGLDLSVSVMPDDGVAVCDPDQMVMAVANLVENAVKYTAAGGVRVAFSETSDGCEITVSDTGVGISASAISRVCERFYRVDGARARDTGGFGLGLSIVSRIVELHSGAMEIASEPGVGTTVCVSIPRHGPPGREAADGPRNHHAV